MYVGISIVSLITALSIF